MSSGSNFRALANLGVSWNTYNKGLQTRKLKQLGICGENVTKILILFSQSDTFAKTPEVNNFQHGTPQINVHPRNPLLPNLPHPLPLAISDFPPVF